ncbi:MAG: Do family serine endopeptidase [Balneolales bacterium]|nr:Do family serine endopeptidase [Balneolales bacterium]
MNKAVRNIFGVAAAMLVLLGFNAATESVNLSLPIFETEVTPAEERAIVSLKDFNDAIVDIAEKTNPAVVTITTERIQEVQYMNPMDYFFRSPFSQPDTETRQRIQRGLGSGVIVSEEGYVLTNHHVIDNVDEIKVRLITGDEVIAELVGTDPQTDIAVLQIDVENLPTVEFGNSDDAKVGSFVLAIGSPLDENLAHTVSFGIVSARGRSIGIIRNERGQAYGFEDFIQTDAAINPGNSGGALIDMNGELIGINSAIASRSGGNDGIGFAIPTNLAKRIMDDLIDDGTVSRGYLGMSFGGEVDRTMALALDLEDTRGILVGSVEEDGPSKKAGLKEDDIIVALNGEEVGNWDAFRTKIAAFKPGEVVELQILRDGDSKTINVELGVRPDEILVATNSTPKRDIDETIGFQVRELTSELKNELDLGNDVEGVIVNSIEEASNAFERGLREEDVIIAVKRKPVEDAEDFYQEIERSIENEDKAILLTIERNNSKQFIAFEI